MAIGRTNAGGKPEEEKTVTAGTSAVTVDPTKGKTMKRVTVIPTPTQCKSVTPSTSQQTVTPDTGKHLSSVVVGAVEDVTPEVTTQTGLIESIKTQLVGKATGANATADKILEGFSAWVNGQLVQGTLKEGVALSMFGCTKMAVDKIIPTSNIESVSSTPFKHSLGEVPKYAFLRASSRSNSTDGYYEIIEGIGVNREKIAGCSVMYTGYNKQYSFNGYAPTMTQSTVGFGSSGSMRAMAGIEYTLITMA